MTYLSENNDYFVLLFNTELTIFIAVHDPEVKSGPINMGEGDTPTPSHPTDVPDPEGMPENKFQAGLDESTTEPSYTTSNTMDMPVDLSLHRKSDSDKPHTFTPTQVKEESQEASDMAQANEENVRSVVDKVYNTPQPLPDTKAIPCPEKSTKTLPVLVQITSVKQEETKTNVGLHLTDADKMKADGKDDRPKPYECKTCGKSFHASANLKKHRRIHTGDKPFKCETCGKSFTQRTDLTGHSWIHTGDKPFKCHVCGKSFTTNSYLSVHYKTHSGDLPFKCEICGKAFPRNTNLKEHSRIHTGEKPYQCKVCGKSFTQGNQLTTHSRIHSDEKPFKCSVCGKSFTANRDLTVHTWMHNGEKPFKCSVCGKSFTRNDHLTVHHRIHSGEKPYECNVCGKAFYMSSHLTKHSRVHTGEKPYQCTICSKWFTSSSNLRNHERTQHS